MSMIHDFRTSITLINASIQELNKEKDLSEKGRYYLNQAIEMSEYLFHANGLKLEKTNNKSQPIMQANELNDPFIKKATEVIYNNILNFEFYKESFAMKMNVSPSLLYKKIKALTGQSPTDFIKSIRLDYAFELLQSHQHTITEVSELSGYSSISYFSTVFKKYFGKSPTEV